MVDVLPNGQSTRSVLERSLFPEGHQVHQRDLEWAQSALAQNLLRRFVDSSRHGVAFGLTVEQNGLNLDRVDIIVDPGEGKGWGYTPSGEFVEITTSQLNLGLSDYTDGAVNYVAAVYTETQTDPTAHETDGVSRPTRANRSFRVRVFSQTEYDALPTTSNNLDVDAQDRVMFIGKVLGNGLTGLIPNALNVNEITQQAPFLRLLTANRSTFNVSGVEIVEVSGDTALGIGTLRQQFSAGALTYSAPGDAFGVLVPATTDGQYTLFSANATDYVIVNVVAALLSINLGTVTDAITVSALYEDDGQRWSARDHLHASKTGAGLPTRTNPHGTSASDLGQGLIDFPQLIRLGMSYLATQAAAQLPRVTAEASTAALVDRTLMWYSPVTGGAALRIYVTATGDYEVTKNARWEGTLWHKDLGAASYKWEFDGAFTEYQQTSVFIGSTWLDTAWSNSTQENRGSHRIGTSLLTTTAQKLVSRLDTPRGTTDRTRLLHSSDISDSLLPFNIYSAETGTDGIPAFEVAVNCEWDGTNWNKFDLGTSAVKVSFEETGMKILYNLANASWTDIITGTAWTRLATIATGGITIGATTQTVNIGRTLNAGSAIGGNASLYAIVPRFDTSVNVASTERWLINQVTNTATGVSYRVYVVRPAGEFYEEHAVGCVWDHATALWSADNVGIGSCGVTRIGAQYGVQHFTKTAPGAATWADTAWDTSSTVPEWRIQADNKSSLLTNGRLQITGGSYSNPASTTAFTNTLMAKNIPKAWCHVITGGGSPTLADGFNVTSVVYNDGNESLLVTLADDMDSANYTVNITEALYAAATRVTQYYTRDKISTEFKVRGVYTTGGAPIDMNFLSIPTRVDVVVFGTQT